jgi:hypothetical protein
MSDLERKAMMFNERGKWKYDVTLVYVRNDFYESNMWKTSAEALKRATIKQKSGVMFETVPDKWFMIIKKPYGIYSHPICVYGIPI